MCPTNAGRRPFGNRGVKKNGVCRKKTKRCNLLNQRKNCHAGEESPVRPILKRRRWTSVEVNKLFGVFGQNIVDRKMPSGKQITELARHLPRRTIAQIRTQVHNYISGKIHFDPGR